MFGDVKRTKIGNCNICGLPVFSIHKEGHRCFKIEYECNHQKGYTSK